MRMYSVLWGHNLNACWPPDQEICRCLLGTAAKIVAPDKRIGSFLGSLSKAKGVCKDGVALLMFPESTSLASRCEGNLKPVLQGETSGYVNRFFP